MAKLTYAIGWRWRPDRESNLKRVLGWLASFPEVEVLVVEQDQESRFSPPAGVRHVFARYGGPFNRSWGFNIAYRESDSPLLAFGDSDIIMRPDEFKVALEASQALDVVSPYSSVVDLSPNESVMPLCDLASIQRPGRGEADNQTTNLCGGVVIFSRSAVECVGGWDEDFVGWGGEDDIMTFKVVAAGLKSALMPFKCYHLWHARAPLDPYAYSRTIRTLAGKVSAGGVAVLDASRSSFASCGDKDRFSTGGGQLPL